MRRLSSRWMAWWYSAISLGFVLLAINRAIAGEKLWLIGVRVVIALGFGLLAAMEFKAKNGKR